MAESGFESEPVDFTTTVLKTTPEIGMPASPCSGTVFADNAFLSTGEISRCCFGALSATKQSSDRRLPILSIHKVCTFTYKLPLRLEI